MKRSLTALAALLVVTACTTPMTTLKHPKTGQVATCGGSANGSFVGGAIGYHMQKSNDTDCVRSYETQGFKVTEVKEY
jgi:hypothetical protein